MGKVCFMKKTCLILIVMLVLTACNSPLRLAPTPSPSVAASTAATENLPTTTLATEIPYPAPTSSPDYSDLPMPTTGPLSTDQPHPTKTPEPLDVSGVWFANLLNAQQGWILSNRELLWTDDTGQHWREMSPTDIGDGYVQDAFFLDPQQVWVITCDPQPSGDVTKITYTLDGGNTWEMTEETSMKAIVSMIPRQGCGGEHIFFLNTQQGWILVDTTQTMNSHQGEMFQTLDGGQTWQHLDTSPWGDFFFVSDTTGWMRATCCTGSLMQLYRTKDGGKTWEVVIANGSDRSDDFFLPVFFDQQTGILAVNLYNEGRLNEGVTFFKTQDGGESWEPIGKLALLPISDGPSFHPWDVQIWDEQTWVVAVPNFGVYWTLDGGQSWVENTTEAARGIFKLALGSATTGWGLKCDQGSVPRCLYLVRTEDMGVHWEKVEVHP